VECTFLGGSGLDFFPLKIAPSRQVLDLHVLRQIHCSLAIDEEVTFPAYPMYDVREVSAVLNVTVVEVNRLMEDAHFWGTVCTTVVRARFSFKSTPSRGDLDPHVGLLAPNESSPNRISIGSAIVAHLASVTPIDHATS